MSYNPSDIYKKQYQKSNIETASQEKILIMMYDGAILFLNRALLAIEKRNEDGSVPLNQYEEIHKNLIGAQNIISELRNTIKRDENPEFADNLSSLYTYFIKRLIDSNTNKRDYSGITEVLEHMKELKKTWEEAIKIASKENDIISGQSVDFSQEQIQRVDVYE